jgi:CubicO group peptidase (beta-lactamase class C family)
MTPRDLARIGSMMLKGGAWGERRVVPAQWIERSTTPMVDVDEIRSYGSIGIWASSRSPFQAARGGIARGSSASGARLATADNGSLCFPASIWPSP